MDEQGNKEMNEELEYMLSLHSMSKEELRIELLSQRDKALNLQGELDTMKFLMADADEDLIYIPTAKRLIREHKQQNLIAEDRRKDVEYVNKCIANGEPYV